MCSKLEPFSPSLGRTWEGFLLSSISPQHLLWLCLIHIQVNKVSWMFTPLFQSAWRISVPLQPTHIYLGNWYTLYPRQAPSHLHQVYDLKPNCRWCLHWKLRKERHTKRREQLKTPTKPNKQKVGFLKKHKPKKWYNILSFSCQRFWIFKTLTFLVTY